MISFLLLLLITHRLQGDLMFLLEVLRKDLRSYKDCLSRQASEAIFISKIVGEILNNKSEFHQPAIVTIRREVCRGLWLLIFGVKTIQFFPPKLIPFSFQTNPDKWSEMTLLKKVIGKLISVFDKVPSMKHMSCKFYLLFMH